MTSQTLTNRFSRIKGTPDSLRSRAFRGYMWSLGGAGISKVLLVLASYYVARQVGQEGFGEYGIYQNTINTLGTIGGVGVGAAATKFIAQYRIANKSKAGRILSINLAVSTLVSILIGSTLFCSAESVAVYFLKNERMAEYLEIGSASVVFSVLAGAFAGAFAGLEKFKVASMISFFGSASNAILQFFLVTWHGLMGVVFAIFLANMMTCIVSIFFLKHTLDANSIKLSFKGCKEELGGILSFNVPAVLGTCMVAPISWACAIFLVNQPDGYSQMGIFTAANQWKVALLFIPTTIGPVVLSLLSSLKDDPGRYKAFFLANLLINVVIAFFMIASVYFFSEFLMQGYGKGFRESSDVLVVMVSVAGLMAINNVVGHAIASVGRMWLGFLFNMLWACELVIASYFLCPQYGAMGLATAYLIAYLLHTIVQSFYVRYRVLRLVKK